MIIRAPFCLNSGDQNIPDQLFLSYSTVRLSKALRSETSAFECMMCILTEALDPRLYYCCLWIGSFGYFKVYNCLTLKILKCSFLKAKSFVCLEKKVRTGLWCLQNMSMKSTKSLRRKEIFITGLILSSLRLHSFELHHSFADKLLLVTLHLLCVYALTS